jgi:predicted naringenin-chalcone synthase
MVTGVDTDRRESMPSTPRIIAIGTANPPHRYSQREIYDISTKFVPFYRNPRIEKIFMSSDIDYRHLAIDFSRFTPDEGPDQLHARFAEHALSLSVEATQKSLSRAGLDPKDIDYVVAVSCTGYLCPGISALLIKEMNMRTNLQRADLIGMGCAGAMPGLQRAHDYVKAYPEKKALVVTVEVCSACYYVDEDLETVVGNAICGDGAAAAVVANGNSGGPGIVQFETLLEPSFIHTVGFQFKAGKLRIVLSKDIRDAAGGLAEKVIARMLAANGLTKADICHWIIHSGGRKVIDSIKRDVGLEEASLEHSRQVLRQFGNMSSPTVLFVLQETVLRSEPQPGDLGVMLAMGPGLAVEAALLRW